MKAGLARRMSGMRRTLIREIFDSAPEGAINLGLGQPDLPTPEPLRLAGISAIAEGRTGYTTTAGLAGLRRHVVDRHPGFADSVDQALITVGSQEAMFLAALTLLDPGDELLYPDPGYPAYPVVARLAGAEARGYPLRPERGFRVDPRDVLERVGPRTRLVILCSPGNPTGAIHEPDAVREIGLALQKRGVWWVSDEIYDGFAYEREVVSASTVSKRGIVISGLSKDLSMTGWRIGWALGPADVMPAMTAAHQYLATCAPGPSQFAALAAFTPEGNAARAALFRRFAARRELMQRELASIPGLDVSPPDGAFYFFVDVSAFGSSLELSRRLIDRRRVVTIPGEAFGERGAGFLRISYAAEEASIVEGIRALAEELQG